MLTGTRPPLSQKEAFGGLDRQTGNSGNFYHGPLEIDFIFSSQQWKWFLFSFFPLFCFQQQLGNLWQLWIYWTSMQGTGKEKLRKEQGFSSDFTDCGQLLVWCSQASIPLLCEKKKKKRLCSVRLKYNGIWCCAIGQFEYVRCLGHT